VSNLSDVIAVGLTKEHISMMATLICDSDAKTSRLLAEAGLKRIMMAQRAKSYFETLGYKK